MLKAILIDDEIHSLESLALLLEDFCPDVQIINKCRSAKEGLTAIRSENPDLVFLDIEMPNINGFEMLEQLNKIPFAVIFTTGYDQYAIKAIRFNALDYLLKPIDPTELVNAIKKVQQQHYLPLAEQFQLLLKQVQNKDHQFNKIAIPTLEGFELLPASHIIRCEAADNYSHLIIHNRNTLTACRTLKEIEEQLHNFTYFLRVHHSHIVNLNEVTRYVRGEGGYLIMSDGSTVSVSRSKKEALLKLF
ncbi:response regulator transcription factor [Flavisolibacter sp. BT320]|nr:response regulator transcription factor [Flavisolibacter longurius]